MRRARPHLLLALLLALATASAQRAAAPPPVADLSPGEFLWHPDASPRGPLVLVVSLDEQRAYVYRNGVAIGLSTISSGKPGHATPTGVFTILQKRRDHRSNLYDDAPMPFMQRLTWDGVALHGGRLPGYPASHGCIRLPHAFAEKLFAATRPGDTVVVAGGKASPPGLLHPGLLAPVVAGGAPATTPGVDAGPAWNDAAAPDGPVSVLASLADRRMYVMRSGVPIAEAALAVAPGFAIGGTVLLVAGAPLADGPDPPPPGLAQRAWTIHPVLGVDAVALERLDERLRAGALSVDPGFARRLQGVLGPGATVLLTDLPGTRAHAGVLGLGEEGPD